jgi:hypothetical protein
MSGKLNIPRIPIKTKTPPKDASKDPNAKHYAVVLRAGAGHQPFTFSMDNDLSACIAALFLAQQYFPHVHTLEVYRKASGDPSVLSDVGEGICKVPMSQLLKFAAPFMEKLTGMEVPSLVTPISRPELGSKELESHAKDIPRTPNKKSV